MDNGEYVKAVKGWKDEVAVIGSGGSDSGLGDSKRRGTAYDLEKKRYDNQVRENTHRSGIMLSWSEG